MKRILITGLIFFLSLSSQAMEVEYIQGQYIVTLKESFDTNQSQASYLFHTLNSDITQISEHSFLMTRQEDLKTIKSILLRNDLIEHVEQDQVVGLLNQEDRFLSNLLEEPSERPNDPKYQELWGLNNRANKGIDIGALEAWKITKGSKDIIVGVIDTGIDYTHPDLKDNMWVNENEIPGNKIDDDQNGFVDDVHGWDFTKNKANGKDDDDHGTHCAGTIGATGNNGIGVVGVNWNVRLMAIKFLGRNSGSLSDAIQSIHYGTKMKANILSNSWGGPGSSHALEKAIQVSEKQGVIFIAAAGNDGHKASRGDSDRSPLYPASYDVENIISVGAMNSRGFKASFSNKGKRAVHVFAPGKDVLSTIRDGKYDKFSGTSMAAPHVAGVAALLLAANPGMNYKEVKERLIRTSHLMPNMSNLSISGGIVNAARALKNERNPISPYDSRFWENFVAQKIDSPKEFKKNTPVKWTLTAPEGAISVAARFSKFKLSGRDVINIYSVSGNPKNKRTKVETFKGGFIGKTWVTDGGIGNSLIVEYIPANNSGLTRSSGEGFTVEGLVYRTN